MKGTVDYGKATLLALGASAVFFVLGGGLFYVMSGLFYASGTAIAPKGAGRGPHFFALLVPCESFGFGIYYYIEIVSNSGGAHREGALPLFPEEGRNERETILRQRKHRRAEGRRPGAQAPRCDLRLRRAGRLRARGV